MGAGKAANAKVKSGAGPFLALPLI